MHSLPDYRKYFSPLSKMLFLSGFNRIHFRQQNCRSLNIYYINLQQQLFAHILCELIPLHHLPAFLSLPFFLSTIETWRAFELKLEFKRQYRKKCSCQNTYVFAVF